ncbi:MAG TPA: TVP38/TMEM64 family protein, partial [Methyloceanibacter sp.]|nr:TVP38/TMEM64 family protein [Methyloceanibacter sp.]
MAVADDKQASALGWLKRLWPLLLLLAAMALVFAMGWHRYLTLQELVERREALRASIAGHTVLAILAFMAIYAATVALSLPGAAVLTLAGGFLFGWFWGALASVAAATVGAIVIFLIARSALGEPLAARAGPWLSKLRAGFQ